MRKQVKRLSLLLFGAMTLLGSTSCDSKTRYVELLVHDKQEASDKVIMLNSDDYVGGVMINNGQSITFDITGGKGDYTLDNSDPDKFNAVISGNTVKIETLEIGSGYVNIYSPSSIPTTLYVDVVENLEDEVFSGNNPK